MKLKVLTKADLPRYEGFGQESKLHGLVVTNPLSRGDDEPVAIVAMLGGTQIGSVGLISGEVSIQGRPVPVVWGSELSVAEEYRHTGAGMMLILRMQSVHHTTAALGPSPIIREIYRKLRWVELPMKRYVLLRHARPVVRRYLRGDVSARAVCSIADVMLRIHTALVASWANVRRRALHAERQDSMSPGFDERLSRVSEPVSCHRSSRWVNWLMNYTGPGVQQLFYVRDLRGHEVGYFMITTRFREQVEHGGLRDVTIGTVQDWMVFDSKKTDEFQLILFAIRELIALDVDILQVCIADERIGKSLRWLGLVQMGELQLVFKASPKSPLADKAWQVAENWRLRPADGDYFFF